MIIFGFRDSARRIGVVILFCRVCNGEYAAALDKISTKFSLFFVPLFPLRVRRVLTCTRCGTSERISKAAAEQIQAQQAS